MKNGVIFWVIGLLCLGFIYGVMAAEPIQVSYGGYNYYPSVSPNGKYVAYMHGVGITLWAEGTVWVYDVETGDRWTVSDTIRTLEICDGTVSWSPDSRQFILDGHRNTLRFYDVQQRELFVIEIPDSATGPERYIYNPCYSHDGRTLAMYRFSGHPECDSTSIVLWNPVDSTERDLPATSYLTWTEVLESRPQWSSDDQYVVGLFYPGTIEPQRQVVELRSFDVGTGKSSVLTRASDDITFNVLGRSVYYAKQADARTILFQNDLSGSGEKLLLNNVDWQSFGVERGEKGDVVYFSCNDSIFTWQAGKITPIGIAGRNPSVQHGWLLYQVYTYNEAAENDGLDSTFSDYVLWMQKLE